ncbi:MAG TPA: putative sugar nucleotidyl transferase [Candidatus Didemnitutus sp.]|nr:putative sugar nucleotidyl transferase [Candidatus Didemnitutus sp.]
MGPVQILLLEHDDVEGLYPFTATHCSWEIRTGLFTILERWQHTLDQYSVSVVSHRDKHVRSFVERYPQTAMFTSAPSLLIAGNVVLSPNVMRKLIGTCEQRNEAFLVTCSGHVVGAFIPTTMTSPDDAVELLASYDPDEIQSVECSGHVLHRQWQALDHIADSISWDATLRRQSIAPSATIHPTVVIDETNGPVMIDENVTIGPYCAISGPVAVGRDTIIKPFSTIATTVIGPTCKVAGEIQDSVIHGYSNKQHDGFLGHSYIGEWVNLGAGTTTSDLKNNYDHIHVVLPWGKEDSQRTFLGLLMGDHSKSAIGTQFSTGTVCGVSSNIVTQGAPTKSIGSFRWLNDTYDTEKAVEVARIVMARRNVVLGPETEALLRYLAG